MGIASRSSIEVQRARSIEAIPKQKDTPPALIVMRGSHVSKMFKFATAKHSPQGDVADHSQCNQRNATEIYSLLASVKRHLASGGAYPARISVAPRITPSGSR
jgi:hypothetical protein